MTDIWISLAAQIPVVIAFMVFMIQWQKRQHEANARNHDMWQAWLDKLAHDSRIERNEWREWIRSRDRVMVQTLAQIEARVIHQSSILLASIARDGGDVDKILEALSNLEIRFKETHDQQHNKENF